MDQIFSWIEGHPTTISIIEWTIVLLVGWFIGAFRWIKSVTKKPKLDLVSTASFAFVENIEELDGYRNVNRVSFFVHAAVINRTKETIVIDKFKLGYQCKNVIKSMRQSILRQAFPSWPRKRLGQSHKLMGAFFTQYGDEMDATLSVSGVVESKHLAAGYLLFVSNTYGSWNPLIKNESCKIRLSVELTTGEVLKCTQRIRVTDDPNLAEDFSPGILGHVGDSSTWNHTKNA